MCGFDNLGCGESEARIRWTYLLEKRGHTVIPLNRKGYTFDTNVHANNLSLDLILTAQVIEQGDITYPDVFSCFFFWAPSSFFTNTLQLTYYNMYMGKYDAIVGGYESKNPLAALSQSPYFSRYRELLPMMASVPTDFVIPCKEKEDLKFFYIGMSLRYKKLLKKLDKDGIIDIYGPKKVFGTEPWKNFTSYRGMIPFDGRSIIKKMHEAGIVLALHSKSHNREHYVSNRIFEAAAAGAIIISDDNEFVRKYFGDSVYYIDIFKDPDTLEKDLAKILNEIFSHKKEAFEKAKRAQNIFLEKLSLDTQVDDFLKFIKKEKRLLENTPQKKIIDCVVYIENKDDFYAIQSELKRQYYKNIRLIICSSDTEVFSEIKKSVSFECSYVKMTDSYFSSNIVSELKGDFFVILNKSSVMHKNHLLKAVQVLTHQCGDFAYSANYQKIFNEKGNQEYKTISCLPYEMRKILNELLSSRKNGNELHNFLSLYPSVCFVFNRKLITADNELCNIPFYATHAALVSKSILGNMKNHDFMYTISAGTKETIYIPKTFMWDNNTKPKDEILDKIRSTYIYMIAKQLNITDKPLEPLIHIQRQLLKILYFYIKIKKVFCLKNKAKYEQIGKQIKERIKILKM